MSSETATSQMLDTESDGTLVFTKLPFDFCNLGSNQSDDPLTQNSTKSPLTPIASRRWHRTNVSSEFETKPAVNHFAQNPLDTWVK